MLWNICKSPLTQFGLPAVTIGTWLINYLTLLYMLHVTAKYKVLIILTVTIHTSEIRPRFHASQWVKAYWEPFVVSANCRFTKSKGVVSLGSGRSSLNTLSVKHSSKASFHQDFSEEMQFSHPQFQLIGQLVVVETTVTLGQTTLETITGIMLRCAWSDQWVLCKCESEWH